MSDEDRKTFLELHEVELVAAGEQLAREYHEMFSRGVNEGVGEAISQFGDQDDWDILQPALLHRVHEQLAIKNRATAEGWETLFFANLNERYDETGDA
jgi:hypothetical protein